MTKIIIISLVLTILFVIYSQYIAIVFHQMKSRTKILSAVIGFGIFLFLLQNVSSIFFLSEKMITRDYEELVAYDMITIDSYDRNTKEIYFTKDDMPFKAKVESDVVEVSYVDEDISTAVFYKGVYKFWIYDTPVYVCRISLSKSANNIL